MTQEEPVSRRRVLAISSNADQRRRIVESLEMAGAEVDAASSVSVTGPPLRHRYLFVGAEGGDPEVLREVLARASDRAHISLVADKASLEELTQYLGDPRVNHVIVGEALELGVSVTARKLLTGDIFGIEKYLPADAEVHCLRLRDFEGRKQALDEILLFAEASGIRRQIRSAIGQVCEELLMNALYDAPVDDEGKQIFAEVEPHARTKSASPRPVSIRYSATPECFAVAVRDRFGQLAKNTILSYIDKCLHSPTQIDRKAYGAGLGLYLVANAAASYVVNVAYDMATEVVCTFDRGPKSPLRLVGVFVHPGQAAKQREAADVDRTIQNEG